MTCISPLRARSVSRFFNPCHPRRRASQRAGPPARSCPRLEPLEDRWVPANPAVNLDQWADLPTAFWQNGNLNPQNSLYAEGQFVPFRLKMENLVPNHVYTVSVQWDTTESSSTHAYDYIGTFDDSASDPNAPKFGQVFPTAADVTSGTGVSSSSFTTIDIPVDTRVTNGADGQAGTADDIS